MNVPRNVRPIFTARQQSYGKVIFSVKSVHQSVILSTGGGGTCTRLWTPFVQDLPSWTCSNLVDMDLIVSCPPPTRHIQTCSLRRTVGKCMVGIWLKGLLVTARKRSFGQGNIFSSVCQEFCSQEQEQAPPSPSEEQTPLRADPLPWDQAPPAPHSPGPGTSPEQTPPRCRPPCAVHAGRYGQQAGGIHPTGMQSCSNCEHVATGSTNSCFSRQHKPRSLSSANGRIAL